MKEAPTSPAGVAGLRLRFLLPLLLAVVHGCSGACLPEQSKALLDFKRLAVIRDPSGTWLSTWSNASSSSDCCLWDGITCDAATNTSVISIKLNNCEDDPTNEAVLKRLQLNALSAQLTPEALDSLSAIPTLSKLDFGCQLFRGSIPPNIANLTSLAYLDLSFQSQIRFSSEILTGDLPDSLWSLPSLQHLDLGYNSFTGSLSPHISNASSLSALFLGTNNFSGSVPSSLSNLTFLQFLDFSSNFQLDTLPPLTWQPQFQLQSLDVSLCTFQGPFPDWLRSQNNLSRLSLAGNRFSGQIPDWAWGLATDFLDLSGNQFSYTFSSSSCDDSTPRPPPSITSLDVSYNLHIQGTFPCFVANLTSLQTLSFASSFISGPILDVFRDFADLNFLDLSINFFDGLLPASMQNLSSLQNLDLSDNPFSYQEVPDFLLLLPSLERIDLAFSNFTGLNLGENATTTSYNPNLQYLKLTSNRLTGSIPHQIPTLFPSLKYLRLDDNHLTGQLPDIFSRLTQLETLDLSDNELEGPLPSTLANLSTSLVILNLNRNRIGGTIPSFVRSLDLLLLLDLGSNQLRGSIPDWLASSLPQLQILSLPDNNLTGAMPSSLGMLKGMINPDFGSSALAITDHDDYIIDDINVTVKGQTNVYSHLQLLSLIDLSHNQLSGAIPSELGELVGLVSLDLSSNRLGGVIPAQFGQLAELESLDLSVNMLQGQIPESFNNLQKLGFVNLSSNHLHGSIPTGTQWLDTFNTSSFLGNDGLCVPSRNFLAKLPLCASLESSSSAGDNDADESEGVFIEWGGFGAGYVAGLVLGFLVALAWVVWRARGREDDMEFTSQASARRDAEKPKGRGGQDHHEFEEGASIRDWNAVMAEIQKEMSSSGPILPPGGGYGR